MNRRYLSAAVVVVAWASVTVAQAQPMVVVLGDTTCPSVEMIHSALPASRPDGVIAGQKVVVDVAADRLSVSLGEPPVVREIPADGDCSVRAESVAVVVATWSGELGDRPTDSPVLTAASPAPVLTPAKRPSHVIELEGSAFYSPLWGHAPGALLGVSRMPIGDVIGVRVLGAYQSARDLAIEGGTNQILRFLVGAALRYQLQRTHVFASGDAGLVGTFTRAQGAGYEPNQADATMNFGGLADLRVGLRLGRFRLWLNAQGLRLVHAETLKVHSTSPGVADSAALNPWDVQIGAGLGIRLE